MPTIRPQSYTGTHILDILDSKHRNRVAELTKAWIQFQNFDVLCRHFDQARFLNVRISVDSGTPEISARIVLVWVLVRWCTVVKHGLVYKGYSVLLIKDTGYLKSHACAKLKALQTVLHVKSEIQTKYTDVLSRLTKDTPETTALLWSHLEDKQRLISMDGWWSLVDTDVYGQRKKVHSRKDW